MAFVKRDPKIIDADYEIVSEGRPRPEPLDWAAGWAGLGKLILWVATAAILLGLSQCVHVAINAVSR